MSNRNPENSDSDRYLLDEEAEEYGWGILNVQLNQFVTQLGDGPLGNDTHLLPSKEQAINECDRICEEGNKDFLRIVKVTLDNTADREAADRVAKKTTD